MIDAWEYQEGVNICVQGRRDQMENMEHYSHAPQTEISSQVAGKSLSGSINIFLDSKFPILDEGEKRLSSLCKQQ